MPGPDVLACLAVIAAGAVVSCQSSSGSGASDAGPDIALQACVTSPECPTGKSCGYPILLGCAAKGVCIDVPSDLDACIGPTIGCACDGDATVAIPGCYAAFDYAPAAVTGFTPCGDAGACAPASRFFFKPNWYPLPPTARGCSTAEIHAITSACFSATPNAKKCETLLSSGTSSGCLSCLVTPSSAGFWGPIVTVDNPGSTPFFNVSACVAGATATTLPCAMTIQAAFACEIAACAGSCSVPASGDVTSAQSALTSCMSRAAAGRDCHSYEQTASSCEKTLEDGGAAYCLEDAVEANVQKYLTIACGPVPGG